jgi:hypothetical protein
MVNLTTTGSAAIGTALGVGGTLGVTGDSTLSTLRVTSSAQFDANVHFNGGSSELDSTVVGNEYITGRLGIGAQNPLQILHISDTTAAHKSSIQISSNSADGFISVGGSDSSATTHCGISDADSILFIGDNVSNLIISNNQNVPIIFGNSDTERVRVDAVVMLALVRPVRWPSCMLRAILLVRWQVPLILGRPRDGGQIFTWIPLLIMPAILFSIPHQRRYGLRPRVMSGLVLQIHLLLHRSIMPHLTPQYFLSKQIMAHIQVIL